MKGLSNSIDQAILNLVREKSSGKNAELPLKQNVTLSELGLGVLDIYDLIVALEDRYQITIDEQEGPADAWTLETLSRCVKRKLLQKSSQTLNWKDLFENLIFSGKVRALRTPLTVHLDLTFRCNSRCIFCYDSSGADHGRAELTTEEVKRILDECEEMDVVEVQFGGGEPFMREDLLDLVAYTKKKNLRIFILTNGTLITEEKAHRLAALMDRRFDNIQVSLDGARPEIHDKQRGVSGNFEKALAGIRNLQQSGLSPVVNTVLTKLNYAHIPEMIPFLIEEGIQVFRVLRLQPLGRCLNSSLYDELKLTPEQSEYIFEFLFEKREELFGQLQISKDNACIFPMSSRTLRSRVLPQPGREPVSDACGAGTSKLAVGPDGSVFPCSYMYEFPELRVGSVRENTLRELWDRDELWTLYRNRLTPTGKCRGCEYLYYCKTGCRIISYAIHGDMGAPDPGCYYEPAGLQGVCEGGDQALRVA